MKRLTVDQTWEQCLAMWKWISRRCVSKGYRAGDGHVELLKKQWMRDNGYIEKEVHQDCFFCHSTKPEGTWGDYTCDKCPAVKIDRLFFCMTRRYHYANHPRLFYAELKRLKKIRLASK